MPNDCTLAALVDCNDQDKTITNFIEQKGYITDYINAGMRNNSRWIRLLEGTKMEFPSGQGDSITRAVLEQTSPNELDGLNWSPVRSNYPGNSACCNTYRKIEYGNRTTTGCLTRMGYITDPFCKVDIVFKSNFMEQLLNVLMSMQNTSTGVWDNWLKASYPKVVVNGMISNKWGHPEQYGTYPADARPTSAPTVEALEVFKERIDAVGGPIGSPITDYVVYVMGRNAFARMKKRRMEQNANLVGARSADFSLPGYNSVHVVGLGQVETWSGMAFVIIDKPRRYREKANNEDWDDAIIPSTISVPTDRGVKTDKNPDYYNSEIAIYEETQIINLQAVDWLVPPAALARDITVGGKTFFPALNYAGDFEPVWCPDDPRKKTVRFSAEFMGGMMSRFPEKGRSLLHYAVHIEACDDDDFVCVNNRPGLNGAGGNAIRWVAPTATANQLNFLITGSLPGACPPGSSLFVTTDKGLKYPVGSIISTTAFPGNSTYPQAGNYVVVQFPTGYDAIANVRDLCDPWKFIQCLPNSTPSDDPNIVPCGVCDNGGAGPVEECTLETVITTDTVRSITTAAGATTIPVTNYTVAATLQTAINTWLSSNGGGTATVTGGPGFSVNSTWVIKIVGSTALIGGSVVYSDGLGDINTIEFGQTGDCSPTS